MKQNVSKLLSVLCCMLFVLVLALYVGAGLWIDQGVDQVGFTEETLLGTPCAADGLTVRLHSTYADQHYWDSEFQLPDYASAHTDYSYRPNGRQNPPDFPIPLEMKNNLLQIYESTVPRELTSAYETLYSLAKAHPNELTEQTFFWKDYVDYYPLTLSFRFSHIGTESLTFGRHLTYPTQPLSPQEDPLQALIDAFQIPVLEEETFTLRMRVDESGNEYDFDFSDNHEDHDDPFCSHTDRENWPAPADAYQIHCFSVQADNTIYFCLNSKSESGTVMDFSHLPQGYGLYALPLESMDVNPKFLPATDELTMLCGLDPNMDILSLSLSPDQQQLLLFAVDNGFYTLMVIDRSGTVLQTLPLAPCTNSSAYAELMDCGNYLVAALDNSDRLAVLSRTEDGTLRLDFDCPANADSWGGFGISLPHAALAYDGERLAVAHMKNDYDQYFLPNSCTFFVDVYSADGLLYSGQFRTSLDTASKDAFISSCHGTDNPLELSWN